MLLELHPAAEVAMDAIIESFIKEPATRHKESGVQLGDILSYVTVSNKYTLGDILPLYSEEQLDRQVLWILKEIPELDHTDAKYKNKDVGDEDERSEVCFKTGLTGFQITMLYHAFNKQLVEREGKKDLKAVCDQMDAHSGCMPAKAEDAFQAECMDIMQVKSFIAYYNKIGQPIQDAAAFGERLRQAIQNSRDKGYHGKECASKEIDAELEATGLAILDDNVPVFEHYDAAKQTWLDA
jgi:hypothetical protein